MLDNPQPSNVFAAADDPPADTDPKPPKTFIATMTVKIAGETFTLSGSLDPHNIIVEYHKPFENSISLGNIETIAEEIGTALHFDDLKGHIQEAHTALAKLTVLGEIGNILLTASIRITDIVINTATKTYGVGLALDFTTSDPLPTLFGIQLISLGFTVTKVNAAQPDPPKDGTDNKTTP
jgi:hypothetical protein